MTEATSVQPDRGKALVRLRNISKHFGKVVAVEPLDLDIHQSDFLAILGPSGCGKTTLLRLIGGFLQPTSGSVEIAGEDVTRKGPERRPTNMVFQGYGLFPHMTVRQNIAYGLRIARRPKAEVDERVSKIIDLVHLSELADRSPDALSGGQQQRVALSRALVMAPKVLLLDEPLAALDLQLRKAMQEELRRIHRELGGTFVFVTHDQSEALGLANRIAVMHEGRMVQEGGPEDIYSRPASRFVANFIGDANILPARRESGRVRLDGGAEFADPGPDGEVLIVVRPEGLSIHSEKPADELAVPGTLADMIYLGSHVKYKVHLSSGQDITVNEGNLSLRERVSMGSSIYVGWRQADHRVLDDR
ncbi:MAG: ABC transporter ATP-binding protein [Alphaproteobacteria bacterium]